ncbi:toll/interleukin-1 receptor domain-containing protein [Rhodoblastus sp.]|uniref:toll/interleukin-1 receptor domain-containing protein n=1 Tax=Rhodoblastus sp. TaxID=1962975 RepID=UPI0035B1AC90
MMTHDVFISYSSLDKTVADAACATLEACGIRCWIAPRDIIAGMEWGDAIVEAINGSKALVLIFSANANTSPQIRREVERAVHKGLPIIPLRIEDIAPTHSLEYFIGSVHWLDALTPPVENHLRRLAEAVRVLLQIDPDRPHIAPSGVVPVRSRAGLAPKLLLALVSASLIVAAALTAVLLRRGQTNETAPQAANADAKPVAMLAPADGKKEQSAPASSAPAVDRKPSVDPEIIGTFERQGIVAGYPTRFVYSIAADGAYRLTMRLQEAGTFTGGKGRYRTISTTGYVRTGTYRAIGTDSVEVTSSDGASAVFQPAEAAPPLNPPNPAMLGRWRAVTIQNGLTWTWLVQNGSDGRYLDEAKAEDEGKCAFAEGHMRCVSTVTGQASAGSYRVDGSGADRDFGPGRAHHLASTALGGRLSKD